MVVAVLRHVIHRRFLAFRVLVPRHDFVQQPLAAPVHPYCPVPLSVADKFPRALDGRDALGAVAGDGHFHREPVTRRYVGLAQPLAQGRRFMRYGRQLRPGPAIDLTFVEDVGDRAFLQHLSLVQFIEDQDVAPRLALNEQCSPWVDVAVINGQFDGTLLVGFIVGQIVGGKGVINQTFDGGEPIAVKPRLFDGFRHRLQH